MWIKVLIAENGFILALYDKEQRVGYWIAKDTYDLKNVMEVIEDRIRPMPEEEEPQE